MHSEVQTIAKPQKEAVAETAGLRVLIAAGGTGGHVYPAIAIADALKELQANITIRFVGTKDRMEAEAVPKAGYDFVSIWISGFHRRMTTKNLLFPVRLIVSLVQSMRIISSFKPHVTICCGGYVTGPVGWAAAKQNIPLFLQEQNSYPGVTNRMLAKHAKIIFTAFKEADQYLPSEKTLLAGNPTRKSLTEVDSTAAYSHFEFQKSKRTLLVLGGSGGAKTINEAIEKNLKTLHDDLGLQIIWQCGKSYFDGIDAKLQTETYENLRLFDYLHSMPEAYEVADLVISRAGALSCSELALTGKPSILIPSPNVAGDHQTKNAQSMADGGAAEILKDDEAVERLPELVKTFIFDNQKLKKMREAALNLSRPYAAEEIAKTILESINE